VVSAAFRHNQRRIWLNDLVVFGLIAYAPKLRELRPRHWWAGVGMAAVVIGFFVMLIQSFHFAHKIIGPKLYQLEAGSPP
jgi:hypothetical protein